MRVNEIEADVKETGVKEIKEECYLMMLKINAMNDAMKKRLNDQTKNSEQNQSKIDDIFQVHKLKFADHEEIDEKRKGGYVTKRSCKGQEFAFTEIAINDEIWVQNQVTILKEFQEWQNIIRFHGLCNEGNKTYLVTEWAEFGNL